MIAFLRNWCEGIIIAVIISIIIETLLPDGNNKKYCNVVIGIYIIFTIISPIFEKLNYDIDISKYFKFDTVETAAVDTSNIQKVYIAGIEESLKNEIEEKFDCKVTKLEIIYDENYENIKDIEIEIKNNGIDEIEKVQIGNSTNENNNSKIDEIKKYILEEFADRGRGWNRKTLKIGNCFLGGRGWNRKALKIVNRFLGGRG